MHGDKAQLTHIVHSATYGTELNRTRLLLRFQMSNFNVLVEVQAKSLIRDNWSVSIHLSVLLDHT